MSNEKNNEGSSISSMELTMGLEKNVASSVLRISLIIPFKMKKKYLEKHSKFGSNYLPEGEDIEFSKKLSSLITKTANLIAEEMIDNNVKNNK